jgi:ribonuclease P protein component
VIDRIGRRESFERFRGSTRSARAGRLRVSVVDPEPAGYPVAVAFAVPRKVGNAVCRNRIRRRLREIFRALDAEEQLHRGWYLVMVRPAGPEAGEPDYGELRAWVHAALARLDGAGHVDG